MAPILAAMLSLSACAGATEGRVHEQVHQTIPASPAAIVHVDNIAGEIRVRGWQKPSVDVTATKYGYDADELRAIAIGAHVEGNEVFIVTTYSSGMTRGGVRYDISVPAGASVRIGNVAGVVAVSGVTGDVEVDTQTGTIDADVGKVADARSIDLHATTGAITLSIAPGSSASVDAGSTVGAFSSDVPGVTERRENLVGAKASGRIGSGSATIRLRTTTGAISLRERS